jgi:hypothetical protein
MVNVKDAPAASASSPVVVSSTGYPPYPGFRALLYKIFMDCNTSQSGDFDPSRLIGYGFLVGLCFVFIGLFIYSTLKVGHFDAANFATGGGVICATLLSVSTGVLIKSPTENSWNYRQVLARNTNLSGFTPVNGGQGPGFNGPGDGGQGGGNAGDPNWQGGQGNQGDRGGPNGPGC